MMQVNKIYNEDCRELLKRMIKREERVDCIIFSPPYWNLREYDALPVIWGGDSNCEHNFQMEYIQVNSTKNKDLNKRTGNTSGQRKQEKSQQINIERGFCSKCNAWLGVLGNEPTFELYISHLLEVIDLLKQVLYDYGSLWLNIGDTSATQGGQNRSTNKDYSNYSSVKLDNKMIGKSLVKETSLPAKCACLIPFRIAIEMIDNHRWILRPNPIIWYKKNPMPKCLSPNTKIFIKDKKGYIKQIFLKDLNKDQHLILTPNGWKRIYKIWKEKKESWKIKANMIDEIECSGKHRFAISHDKRRKIMHYIEIEKIRYNTYKDKLIYSKFSQYLNKAKINQIDVIDIEGIDWFADFSHIEINETPLELAKKSKDITLRKHKLKNNNWCYASNTHNEIRRRVIRVKRVKEYKFNKVSAFQSPKFENRFYKLDYDLGWLIGIYTAEGGFNQPRGFQGVITLHKKEYNIAEKFMKIFSEKFGIETNDIKEKRENAINLTFSSACFYAITKLLLVKGKCISKKMNINYLLNTPREFRQGLIDGYILGDGHLGENGRISVASASKELIRGIQTIYASIDKLLSYSKREQFDKRTNKTYVSYWLWTNSYHEFDERGFSYIKPKDFIKTNEIKDMIDIEVEENVFLIENGLISHNSVRDAFTPDYEYLLWFVKDNKKKKQFWTNKKTLEITKKKPLGINGVENEDWHWVECPKCKDDDYIEIGKECSSCKGLGKRKRTLWRSHDYYFEQQFDKSITVRNKRCVWQINTKGHAEVHFAIFPEKLIETPIKATCPLQVCKQCGLPKIKIFDNGIPEITQCNCNMEFRYGIVFDAFAGIGSTGKQAAKLGRDYILCDISEKYCNYIKNWQKDHNFKKMDNFI